LREPNAALNVPRATEAKSKQIIASPTTLGPSMVSRASCAEKSCTREREGHYQGLALKVEKGVPVQPKYLKEMQELRKVTRARFPEALCNAMLMGGDNT